MHYVEPGDESEGKAVSPRRLLAFLLAIVPPSLLANGNPEVFLSATSIAGAYFDTLLYGVLPPTMAFALRAQRKRQTGAAETLIPGGVPALAICAIGALGVAASKLAGDLGLLEVPDGAGTEVAQLAEAVVGGSATMASLF